jgi:plastocyanin
MPGIIIKVQDGKVVFQPDRPRAKPGDPLQVFPGDFVVWNNRTDDAHHPVAIDPPGLFLTEEIPPRQPSDPKFNVTKPSGTKITYKCSLHPDEAGTIDVI